jgi:hypothetical protein
VNDLIPAGCTVLTCGCLVPSKTGELATCPAGHNSDAPDHHRKAPQPRGR